MTTQPTERSKSDMVAHHYPEPKPERKAFSPVQIDFGARRTSWAWALVRFVWALMFWCLFAGGLTVSAILVATIKGYI